MLELHFSASVLGLRLAERILCIFPIWRSAGAGNGNVTAGCLVWVEDCRERLAPLALKRFFDFRRQLFIYAPVALLENLGNVERVRAGGFYLSHRARLHHLEAGAFARLAILGPA